MSASIINLTRSRASVLTVPGLSPSCIEAQTSTNPLEGEQVDSCSKAQDYVASLFPSSEVGVEVSPVAVSFETRRSGLEDLHHFPWLQRDRRALSSSPEFSGICRRLFVEGRDRCRPQMTASQKVVNPMLVPVRPLAH